MTCQKNVNKNETMIKIKKLFNLIRKIFLKILIRLHMPLKTQVKLNKNWLSFHDVASSLITEQIMLEGFRSYEPELVRFFENYPFEFNSFIDAGANIGFYSILMREIYGNAIDIKAIEPFPANIAYMEEFKVNNQIDFDILPYALSEKEGEEKPFYVPTTHRSSKLPPAASLINNFGSKDALFKNDKFKEVKVKTISLASVLAELKTPHLMKLDIEGYEYPVLQSIKEYLQSTQTLDLVVEIMINDTDKKEVFDLLTSCGFHGYLITNAGLIREDRALTLPYYHQKTGQLRTCWKNHFFTKRSEHEIETLSQEIYGYFI